MFASESGAHDPSEQSLSERDLSGPDLSDPARSGLDLSDPALPVPELSEQDLAERRLSIVDAARGLAEAEGWEAVTPRRVADRVGCDQPTLYQHFEGREAILVAVAVRGFAELAVALGAARSAAADAATGWPAVVESYLDFAYANPEVYDAMLLLTADLPVGPSEPPTSLHAVFGELRAALQPHAAGRDLDALAEVGWSVLHGMVMLTRGGRLRPDLQDRREALVMGELFGRPPS